MRLKEILQGRSAVGLFGNTKPEDRTPARARSQQWLHMSQTASSGTIRMTLKAVWVTQFSFMDQFQYFLQVYKILFLLNLLTSGKACQKSDWSQ